jgi:hypothetical protein
MSRQVSNVDIITDSFEIWLLETNELLNSLSTEILTANVTCANTGNSIVSRTAQLWGQFGANNLVISNWLRGGNVNGAYTNLMISTNTMVSNNNAANLNSMVINSSSFSYITPIGGYFGNTIANSTINTTSIITQSNSTVNTNITPTQVQVINSTSNATMTPISFKTGIFTGNTIAMSIGANVIANSSALLVNSNYSNTTANATTLTIYSANATSNALISIGVTSNSIGFIEIGGTDSGIIDFKTPISDDYDYRVKANTNGFYIIGGSSTSTANVVYIDTANLNVDSGTLFVDQINNRVGVGNTAPDATLAVTGTANVSGSVRFANTFETVGNSTFGNSVTHQTALVIDVATNTNIGATIGLVPIYSFPKATYSSGRFTVQVKNTGNTQIADMLVAHDNTTAYVTVFGTVASPAAANGSVSPLGNFIANVNGSNIDLLINQTVASSAVKVVANLIK